MVHECVDADGSEIGCLQQLDGRGSHSVRCDRIGEEEWCFQTFFIMEKINRVRK